MNDGQVTMLAQAAHEVNRAYCILLGDTTQLPWEDAPVWQHESAISGVLGVLDGNNPPQSHAQWYEEKRGAGWKWGPVKDPEKKEHPCFLPYYELPPEQKLKDDIFVGVVSVLVSILKGHEDAPEQER